MGRVKVTHLDYFMPLGFFFVFKIVTLLLQVSLYSSDCLLSISFVSKLLTFYSIISILLWSPSSAFETFYIVSKFFPFYIFHLALEYNLLYRVMLVSAAHQSESATRIRASLLLDLPPRLSILLIQSFTEHWAELLVDSRFPPAVYFTHGSVCTWIVFLNCS